MQKVQIEPFNIIGIYIRTTNENEQSAKDISKLWQQFMSEDIISKIPNKVDDLIYSLYTSYESDHTQPYTTILGCKVYNIDTIPEGMVGESFNGGTYIKTCVKGDLTQGLIGKHWYKIFDMELKRNFIADYETYGEKAQNPKNAEVEFYVGIK